MEERTLLLTGLCLKLNPANYTIWHFRRQCLEVVRPEDDTKIIRDLELAARLGGTNPKNYQIWYHRRAILETHGSKRGSDTLEAFLEDELNYVGQVLLADSKNYHAWSHRQWVVRTFPNPAIWEQELQFAHKLIEEDPRNNSAWNYRWFTCHEGGKVSSLAPEIGKREADYAIEGARIDPYNESPWRYFIAVIKEQLKIAEDKNALLNEFEVNASKVGEVLEEDGRDPNACASLVSARIDLLEWIGDVCSLSKAIDFATALATEHDPIRKKYWFLRVEEMKSRLP